MNQNNNGNDVITIQEYHVVPEKDREKQFADPWSRQDLYRNLYRIADLDNTACSHMRFWQFILAFYDFCVRTIGNTAFIDNDNCNLLYYLDLFCKEIGADDYQIRYEEGDYTGDGFDYLQDFHFTLGLDLPDGGDESDETEDVFEGEEGGDDKKMN